ncbi:Magnesium transport protein CorA [compost metagenome]
MKRFEHKWSNFTWVDCESPAQSDLVDLSQEFNIPMHYLATCLDPEHLVRLEFFDSKCFLILRLYDKTSDSSAGTIQELTTKIIFFVGPDFVLTLHRANLDFIEDKKHKVPFETSSPKELMKYFCNQTISSFDQPITMIENKTDIIEDRIYALKRKNILRKGYVIKRRASAFKKVLKFSMEALQKLQTRPDLVWGDFQDLKDYNDRMIFYADDVLENITGLLNLHISLMSQKTNEASFRTNEVMRVLTLVSIFFLPLNFIAGIYGMNFENMPELKTAHGYQYTLMFMGLIALGISLWIYRKGWITKEDIQAPSRPLAPKPKKHERPAL